MPEKKTKTIFITGTGTDVGKTLITAGIASLCVNSGLKTAVMKPVQTGVADCPPDLQTIHDIVPGLLSLSEDLIAPYVFQLPASPHLAAKEEQKSIAPEKIKKAYNAILDGGLDILLIEGAGGVFVPLNEEYLMLDLIKEMSVPVIVTALAGLGTINHTLLTVNALKQAGLEVAGIIINKMQHSGNGLSEVTALIEKDNVKIIEKLSETPILGVIHDLSSFDENFSKAIAIEFDKQDKLKSKLGLQ